MGSLEELFEELTASLAEPADAASDPIPDNTQKAKTSANPNISAEIRRAKNERYAAMNIADRDNLIIPETRRDVSIELNRIQETPRLTTVSICTATLAAYYPGIQFSTAEIMKHVVPSEIVRVIHSNYGVAGWSDSDVQNLMDRKSATHRRKSQKQKLVQRRRAQGSGIDFNSQITFELFMDGPESPHPLKFKIFQTGTVQLPRALPELLDKLWRGFAIVEESLHSALKRMGGDTIPAVMQCKFSYYVLKNYKFLIKMGSEEKLRLDVLRQICHEERLARTDTRLVVSPRMVKSSNLTLTFATPQQHKSDKELLMQIFMKGKVGILGGLSIEDTIFVYHFLDQILCKYWSRIVA